MENNAPHAVKDTVACKSHMGLGGQGDQQSSQQHHRSIKVHITHINTVFAKRVLRDRPIKHTVFTILTP